MAGPFRRQTMKRTIILSIAASLITFSAFADEHEGRIQERQENQQARIAQGVKFGQLTAGETGRIETREDRLNKEVRKDRAANGGTLTGVEKRQINHQQNSLSKSIYRDKHNRAVQSR
jgi:hypothetical protein